MNKLLSKLWDKRARLAKDAKGFTLIELLVVVVILGVLIAIAIPLYLNYRKGANDSAAQSDLRNAISAFEQCNADNASYPSAVATTGGMTGCLKAANTENTVALSSGTTLTYAARPGTRTPTDYISYIMVTTNSSGSGKYYCYDSAVGGSVGPSITGTAVATGTCADPTKV